MRACSEKPTLLHTMIDTFLHYLKYERNYSERTVESYAQDLRLFHAFFTGLDEELTWQTVDTDIVRDWMEQQMDSGHSATTINRRLCALRSMYRYALKHKLVERDPARIVKGPKTGKPLPKFIGENDMNALIDNYPWQDTYEDQRNRTIILLFYTTGMRASELIMLNDADIDFINREIKVTGKGRKQRNIPFADELEQTLKQYVALRDGSVERATTAFFVDSKGIRLNYNKLVYLVRKLLTVVTTQKTRTPHVLRHSFATAMMNHEAGIETVKNLLGHESVRTTTIYTHTTFAQLQKAYNKAHPRLKGKAKEGKKKDRI